VTESTVTDESAGEGASGYSSSEGFRNSIALASRTGPRTLWPAAGVALQHRPRIASTSGHFGVRIRVRISKSPTN
jgi:hypothetical protein